MALIFSDGFDSYAATADLTKKYSSAVAAMTFSSSGGRFGGGGMSCTGGAGNGVGLISRSIAGGATTGFYHCGFYFKCAAPNASFSVTLFGWRNSSNTNGCGLILGTTGLLIGSSNSSGTNTTGSHNVADNNWHWIEWKHTAGSSNTTFQAYVDGVLDLNASVSNGALSLDHIAFWQNSRSVTYTIDDLIIYDNNSPAPQTANFPLGARRITTVRPSSDSTVQFTPNSGAVNFSRVNEANADGDTTYVEDATSGHQDLYGYDSIGFTPAVIDAVMVNSYAESPFGNINFKQVCKSSTTQTDGTSTALATSYRTYQQQFAVDPNTSAAWTKSGLDAALFGVKVV